MGSVVRLRKVTKVYKQGEERALDKVNLTVGEGDFLGIVGPSGSGKSTLLNIIGLLDRPSRGTVYYKEKNTRRMGGIRLAKIRRRVGFIFQAYNLLPPLTAVENVEFPMSFNSVSARKRRRRALELLSRFGLEEYSDRYFNELSMGQQQRVAIARALATNPILILGDEPTGNVDSKSGEAIMQEFKRLNEEEGMTIVVVSHDPRLSHYAKQIIQLFDGRIVNVA